jgi:hypothetical protein
VQPAQELRVLLGWHISGGGKRGFYHSPKSRDPSLYAARLDDRELLLSRSSDIRESHSGGRRLPADYGKKGIKYRHPLAPYGKNLG